MTWVQIQDEADCISYNDFTLEKYMNQNIFLPDMGK